MTQSIIVYRNPLEQQIWESGMVGPIFVFVVLTVAFVLILSKLGDKIAKKMGWSMFSTQFKWLGYAELVLGVFLAGFLVSFLL